MEYLYLQNPTLKFAQQAHSYSSGMIQVASCFHKQVCLEIVCLWTCWSLNFCCCQMELENKQQLTVSLFWLNLYRVPGCFPWIQIWMTIQSNANHEFIPLAYVLTTLHKTMGKEVLSSLHYRQPKNFTKEAKNIFLSLLWCCTGRNLYYSNMKRQKKNLGGEQNK